jgi:hypothetical protein
VVLAAALWGALTVGAAGSDVECAGTGVWVRAAEARDARTACEAAADAVRFLRTHGLDASERVELYLTDQLPQAANPGALGCYRHPERRAYVRTFRAFLDEGRYLGLPADRILYRGLIAHEVGHAIAARNFAVPVPTLAAQEYVAHVTMFSTLPESYRRRAIERFPGGGYADELTFNNVVYAMDPEHFGVQAYRHYASPGKGPAFLREVLLGNALNWDGPP